MEISHRVSFNADFDKVFFETVNQLGIKYKISPLPGHDVGLVTFEIIESNIYWERIKEFIEAHRAVNLVWTNFSSEEIINSEWNRLVPVHEWGYPQPETGMKWKQCTYADMCPKCGAGFKQ